MKNSYCKSFDGECLKEKCAVFGKRRMTQQEIEGRNAADIPVIDPYIYNWCFEYNKKIGVVICR